jgi:hypothetical protein
VRGVKAVIGDGGISGAAYLPLLVDGDACTCSDAELVPAVLLVSRREGVPGAEECGVSDTDAAVGRPDRRMCRVLMPPDGEKGTLNAQYGVGTPYCAFRGVAERNPSELPGAPRATGRVDDGGCVLRGLRRVDASGLLRRSLVGFGDCR